MKKFDNYIDENLAILIQISTNPIIESLVDDILFSLRINMDVGERFFLLRFISINLCSLHISFWSLSLWVKYRFMV